MTIKRIILIGGGGHCKSCIDVIEKTKKYKIIGIIDLPEKVGQKILGYPIIGVDEQINFFSKETDFFFITIGQLGLSGKRKEIFNFLITQKHKVATIVSPLAYVSQYAKVGIGTIVMHNAIINAESRIGNNCIINTKALIEHDAIIGSDCHISTSSTVNGGANIGNNCFYGSGSVCKEYINIVSETIIGANSFIRKPITTPGIYSGNPIKRIIK